MVIEFFVFSIGLVLGWFLPIRKRRNVLMTVYRYFIAWCAVFTGTRIFFYPEIGEDLTSSQILRYKILIAVIWCFTGYCVGKLSRMVYLIKTAGKATDDEPSKSANVINKFGARMFKNDSIAGRKDEVVAHAIEISHTLFADVCGDNKRLAAAIAKEYDLSANERIDLLFFLNRKKPEKTGAKKKSLKFDANQVDREQLFAGIIGISKKLGIDLSTLDKSIKGLAEELEIGKVRAGNIVSSVLSELSVQDTGKTNSKGIEFKNQFNVTAADNQDLKDG